MGVVEDPRHVKHWGPVQHHHRFFDVGESRVDEYCIRTGQDRHKGRVLRWIDRSGVPALLDRAAVARTLRPGLFKPLPTGRWA